MATKTTKNSKPRSKTLTGSSGIVRGTYSEGGKLKIKKRIYKKK